MPGSVGGSSYVVAAPRRSDAIAATLCAAYPQVRGETDGFADVLAALNAIDTRTSRR